MKSREARFSKIVNQEWEGVYTARKRLLAALEGYYPMDSLVRVIHPRGEYLGFVVGHDAKGARVVIKNEITGKISRRFFREVERA